MSFRRNAPVFGRRRFGGIAALFVLGLFVLGLLVQATDDAPTADAIPDLSGTWAMVQFMPEVGNLPLVGESTVTAVVALVVDIEQTGTDLAFYDTYCHTEVLCSNWILKTEVPDLAVQSFDPPVRTGRIYETEDGWKLEQDWHLEIRGCTLEAPETEELPVSADDPRVFDSDGDGHPGFTIPVSALGIVGGDTYVVQRLRYRTADASVSADRIEGPLDWSSEQIVVGATNGFLMTGFEQWHDPDPDVHRFFMVRLEPEADCEAALAVLEETLVAFGGA